MEILAYYGVSAMNYQIAIKVSPHEGHYLTEIDWQQVEVSALSYDLETVVFQSQHTEPCWENIPEMVHPWSQSVLIDLRNLSFKKEMLTIRSPYSGQKYRIDWSTWLRKAIHNLDYYWIIPNAIQSSLPVEEWLSQMPQDKLLQSNPKFTLPKYWQLLENEHSCFMQTLDQQHKWLLSEQLCQKTAAGWVLDEAGPYQITDPKWEKSTDLLANNCVCEACKLGLQRCYFHHLHSYVPLLANRYLTLHNFSQLKFYG